MDWNKFKTKNPELDLVEISYNGCGDSGNVEVETDFKGDFQNALERWGYDFLETKVGGWEIDSGSQGTIKINLKTNKVNWEHGDIVEEVDWADPVESDLED